MRERQSPNPIGSILYYKENLDTDNINVICYVCVLCIYFQDHHHITQSHVTDRKQLQQTLFLFSIRNFLNNILYILYTFIHFKKNIITSRLRKTDREPKEESRMM